MKKIVKYLLFGLSLFILSFNNCYAADVLCHDVNVLKAMKIVGTLIMIIKIVVPIIIILTSIISMVNAILYEDDNALKKSFSVLIQKVIVGAIIFFIPSLIYAVLSLTANYDKTKNQFTDCGKCITSLKECEKLIDKYK